MNRHRDGTQKGTIARVSIAAVTGVPNDSPQAFAVNCHRANRPRSANDLSTPQMLGAGLACRRVAPLVLPHRRGSSATVAPSALPENRQATWTRIMSVCTQRGQCPPGVRSWLRGGKTHQWWFGDGVPAVPLTAECLRAVPAMLIRGNYRSAEN